MTKTNGSRVYRPLRSFDDDLVDLAEFFRTNQMSIDGVDAATLATAAESQREVRAEEGRLVNAWKAHHEMFIRDQRARYELYAKAVSFARTKYRDDPAKLAELVRFKRRFERNGNGHREVTPVSE